MTAQTPTVAAVQKEESYQRAKREAMLRGIRLVGRVPGNREAALFYLRASREYEEANSGR